jgi:hypothetical protein
MVATILRALHKTPHPSGTLAVHRKQGVPRVRREIVQAVTPGIPTLQDDAVDAT